MQILSLFIDFLKAKFLTEKLTEDKTIVIKMLFLTVFIAEFNKFHKLQKKILMEDTGHTKIYSEIV